MEKPIIGKIKDKLQRYPHVKYAADAHKLTIEPSSPQGFVIYIEVSTNGYYVAFEGWHEVFSSEEEALNCVAFGLSSECRLKVLYRGKSAYKWIVESKQGDNWKEDSQVGLLWFQFWRKKRVEYRQNSLI